jgi:hypothetical protein
LSHGKNLGSVLLAFLLPRLGGGYNGRNSGQLLRFAPLLTEGASF